MTDRPKPPTLTDAEVKSEIVNDSLGTTDPADSTGLDDPKETERAKTKFRNKTRGDNEFRQN